MATRKTAAQKAAEAAERDEYAGTTIEKINTEQQVEAPAEPTTKKETVPQLKNRLRNEAEREVLNNHKAEYVRRLTEEEKAAKVIEELYEKFPQLRPAEEVEDAPVQGDTYRPYTPAVGHEGFPDEPTYASDENPNH